MNKSSPLLLMAQKLSRRALLSADDFTSLCDLPCSVRTVDPFTYLVREGEPPVRCPFIVEGFAFRQKLTREGARQILSVQIPGDFVDTQNLFLNVSDHNVQALTRATLAYVAVDDLRSLLHARPAINKALWIDTLIDAAVVREWTLNVGRRDARTRIAHFLCEFAVRLKQAGLVDEYRYELPMTQEQIADVAGLTPVHVNRVLRQLSEDGFIRRAKRFIDLSNWEGLIAIADFSERYLHLDQMANEPRMPAAA